MANWSKLVHEILVKIVGKINSFVAFGWVCTSGRSAANIENCGYMSDHRMPLLMLPSLGDGDERGFFDMSNGVTRQVFLPEANKKKCLSSKGWLLTVGSDLSITLLHPLSRLQVQLPSIKGFKDWEDDLANTSKISFFEKFALSSGNLSESDYTVMVIHGSIRKLAYFKPGQTTWITMDTWKSSYFDVVYYKDKFYAIDCWGRIMACDLSDGNSNPTVAKQVAEMPPGLVGDTLEQVYLVESTGALLVVNREGVQSRDGKTYGTFAFQVFEVDLRNNTWREVKDIGNRALFLGHNSSMSMQVLDSSVWKPNSIYFTDDCRESYLARHSTRYMRRHKGVGSRIHKGGGKDMGIYNIKDGSIVPHVKNHYRSYLAPPMWIEQTT